MMNCHDATFLMSQSRERKLSFSERMKVRLHAGMCSGCAQFERQLPGLGVAARAFAQTSDQNDT